MSHSRQSCYIPLAPTPLSRYSKKLLFFLSSFFSWFPQVTSPVAYCKGEIYPASRKRTAYGVRAGLFLVDKTSSTSDWISNQINNPPRQKADLCKRKAMSLDRFSVPIATKNQKKRGCCYSFFPRHFLLSPKNSCFLLTPYSHWQRNNLLVLRLSFSRFVPIFLEGERQANIVRAPLPQSMVAKVTVGRAPGVRVSVCVFAGKVSAKTFYIASLHCHLINFERHRYCFTRMGSATRPAETKLRRVWQLFIETIDNKYLSVAFIRNARDLNLLSSHVGAVFTFRAASPAASSSPSFGHFQNGGITPSEWNRRIQRRWAIKAAVVRNSIDDDRVQFKILDLLLLVREDQPHASSKSSTTATTIKKTGREGAVLWLV